MANGGGNGLAIMNEERLARGLGWFSIGLGLAEVLAPRTLSRLIGIRPRPFLLRLLGLREIASGIGILRQQQPAGWVQARVAGDAMDLTLLGAALSSRRARHGRLVAATAAVAGVTALDVRCSRRLSQGPGGVIHAKRVITINRSPGELYELWHRLEEFPRFMPHIESVQRIGDKRFHWVAKGPGGIKIEWDSEIIEDRPNEYIAWRSVEGADVPTSGSVRFEPAPGGRGTVVRTEMEWRPPAGPLGATVARLLGHAPEKHMAVGLLRFKQWIETGEIARTEGQPAGRPRSTSRKYDELVRAGV